jgi:hypothetical protein
MPMLDPLQKVRCIVESLRSPAAVYPAGLEEAHANTRFDAAAMVASNV